MITIMLGVSDVGSLFIQIHEMMIHNDQTDWFGDFKNRK